MEKARFLLTGNDHCAGSGGLPREDGLTISVKDSEVFGPTNLAKWQLREWPMACPAWRPRGSVYATSDKPPV